MKREERDARRRNFPARRRTAKIAPLRQKPAGRGAGDVTGGRGIKCRLPQYSGVSFGFQTDAFFSGDRTEAEQGQNEPSHCKTDSGNASTENENPGALAGATGAVFETSKVQGEDYTPVSSHAMPDIAKGRRARAAHALGCVLEANSPNLWEGFALILKARLTEGERGLLAYSALRSLDPVPRELAFNAAHWGALDFSDGAPVPLMRAARSWADHASEDELKAFAAAAYQAMSRTAQVHFVGYVMRAAA